MNKMKKMSKKEIIDFFIEQLGDNKILGKIMSIEQIREKLNYIIKDVTYKRKKVGFPASTRIEQDGRVTVNFDLKKITECFGQISEDDMKFIIVHELLHALSTTTISLGIQNVNNNEVEEKIEKMRVNDKLYRLL